VTVENGTLQISGERRREEEQKSKRYHRMERAYGTFERTFLLPEGVKAKDVTAEYKNGVLKVRLPKKEAVKTKPMEIKVV
jgi:HSP20 family protein